MTLAALGRWGVVHRVWVRGQRREHYEAETDFWKMIAGVLNERERREIGAAVDAVARGEASARAALAAAKTQTGAAGKKLKAEADFTVVRLGRLNEICRAGRDACSTCCSASSRWTSASSATCCASTDRRRPPPAP